MYEQISLFDGNERFIIDKPIRLIELFAGYGSQALSLKYNNMPFEHHKISEWAVKSIQAYKDMHFPNDNTDYSKDLTFDEIIEFLANKGISANYNEPMTKDQIKRQGEEKCRTIYNNIVATHNLVSVTNVKGKDLDITETDKYCYIMTYSFPCTDLSSVGLRKGMDKDGNTRSGLLWEVERILNDLSTYGGQLPQVLLMENVPEVIGSKNIHNFAKWVEILDKLGYKSKWQVLNAKDYGIPQNRNRCFMVSILGDYWYEFPKEIKLEHKLKDLLEDNVDEKYYLSKSMIKYITTENGKWTGNNNKSIINRDIAVAITTITGNTRADCSDYICKELLENFDLKKLLLTKNQHLLNMIKNNKIDISKTQSIDLYNQKTNEEIIHTIRASVNTNNETAITHNYRIRKLTPKECFRLMGVKDEDFERVAKNQSNSSLYHLAGDSIVVNVLQAIFNQMR